MFNTLYRCPLTIARHENGPLAESRRRYLEHLAAREPRSTQSKTQLGLSIGPQFG